MNAVSHLTLLFLMTEVSGISIKKGISLKYDNLTCEDFQLFPNISWWYDWRNDMGYHIEKLSNCTGVSATVDKYIPMTWGSKFINENLTFPEGPQFVLGFNEPNHKTQSNLTAARAAELWGIIEANAGNRSLVAPVAAKCGNPEKCLGQDTEWLDEFFELCDGCRVDYIAAHYYNCNANKTMDYIENLYNRYNRTVWLTEFACKYTHNASKHLAYMVELLPMLEAADFVYRYAWFTARRLIEKFVMPSASLLKDDTDEWTELGQFYYNYTP